MLKRAWCLYEISCSKSINIAMSKDQSKLLKDIDEFHKNNNKGRIGLKKIIEYFVPSENTIQSKYRYS